jgi:hypothetical protein
MNPILKKWNEEDTEGRITMIAWGVLLVPAVIFSLFAVAALFVWGGLGLLNDYFSFLPDDLGFWDAWKIALGISLLILPWKKRQRLGSQTYVMSIPLDGSETVDSESSTV